MKLLKLKGTLAVLACSIVCARSQDAAQAFPPDPNQVLERIVVFEDGQAVERKKATCVPMWRCLMASPIAACRAESKPGAIMGIGFM